MPEVHCRECGQSWGEDATFCGGCGGRLPGRPVGQTVRAERSIGSDGRGRWLVAAIVVAVAVVAAGTATITQSSTSDEDEVATGDDEVVVPDREGLQEPDGEGQTGRPQVSCEREGEPVECVAWMHRLASASSVPDLHSWRVEATSDRVVAQDAETMVALSRTSGQRAWRKGFDGGEGPAGGPSVLGEKVVAVRTGQAVRGLSLADGSESWSVDRARLVDPGRRDQPGTIYTVQLDGGWAVLASHDEDGTVRWRHEVAEVDPAGPALPLQVAEVGSMAFVVRHDRDHDLHTIALDRDDGTERWRRTDSRPLHAWGDIAVMLDVDRDVREENNGVSVSESPAAVVGIDDMEGTQRWRNDAAGEHQGFRIVDDVLVTLEADGLTGIDLATGEDRWHREVDDGERMITAAVRWGQSVDRHRRVFSFVPRDRRVLARDPATGEVIWQTQLDELVGRVSTVEGAILARVNETTTVQLDPATGRVRGTITMESDGRPQFIAGDVLVDPETGWAVRVDLSGGAGDRMGGDEHEEESQALVRAGFTEITGLELVDASSEAGIDTLEMFLLRGSAEHVDQALEAAAFDAPPSTGMRVTQPPLGTFDPERLADVVSAEDRWEAEDGRSPHRLYVRGEAPGGQHLLHVWAFTT